MNHAEWLTYREPGQKDVAVADRRVFFIDGLGLVEGTVFRCDEEKVVFHPDGWVAPFIADYECMGVTIEEADAMTAQEKKEDESI